MREAIESLEEEEKTRRSSSEATILSNYFLGCITDLLESLIRADTRVCVSVVYLRL